MSGLRNPIGDTHYTFVLDFWPTPFCPPYCGNTALLAEVSLSFACSILILRTQEWINQDLCWAWEACCWAIISNPGLIAVCLLQCTVGSVMTIGLSIPVNPLLSPLSNKWPLSNNKCPPLQRRKVNKPPSLLSPPPPPPSFHTYSSQTINVDWSVIFYSGWKFILFMVFGPMTFNFMCLSFSTLCSSSLWRITIFLLLEKAA